MAAERKSKLNVLGDILAEGNSLNDWNGWN